MAASGDRGHPSRRRPPARAARRMGGSEILVDVARHRRAMPENERETTRLHDAVGHDRPRRVSERRKSAPHAAATDGMTVMPRTARRPPVSTATTTAFETIRRPWRDVTGGASGQRQRRWSASERLSNACTRSSIASQSRAPPRFENPVSPLRGQKALPDLRRRRDPSVLQADQLDHRRRGRQRRGCEPPCEGLQAIVLAGPRWPAGHHPCRSGRPPLWWFSRSGVRSPCPAAPTAATSMAISRWTASSMSAGRKPCRRSRRSPAQGRSWSRSSCSPSLPSTRTTADDEAARWPPDRPRAAPRQ